MKRLYSALSWITLFTFLGGCYLIGFWLVYPYKVVDFMTEPHEVLTPVVHPGDHIEYVLDYCKHQNIGSEVTVSFVDGFIYNTTPIASNLEEGCHTVVQSVYVPRAIPVGEYHLSTLYRVRVNPIRVIDYFSKTDKFQVVK